MHRCVLYLGLLSSFLLGGIGMGFLIYYGDKIPTSLSVQEQFDPNTGLRYTVDQMNEAINRKRDASEAFRFTIAGAAMLGGCVGILALGSLVQVCWEPRYEDPGASILVGPHQVAPLQRQPTSASRPTARLPTSSPATTVVSLPTSAPSPLATFRLHEPAPRLAQTS